MHRPKEKKEGMGRDLGGRWLDQGVTHFKQGHLARFIDMKGSKNAF